ncbi:hypothetical protein Bbelb_193390 [Branchiostoma belcheri]|nr:hypothetical protein Bbelb_193390 [Branchiostoma belcheri]
MWKSATTEVLETRQNAVSQGAGDTAGTIQSRCEAVEIRCREHSSFVAKDWEGFGPCFGRIQFVVRHRFLGGESDLAYIKWLPPAEREDETNLFVIDPELPPPQLITSHSCR